MKNIETWENMNAEDQTAEETATVTENTDDENVVPAPVPTSDDTDTSESTEADDSAPETNEPDDESEIEEDPSSDSESEVAEEDEANEKPKISRKEKITLIISGIVLLILLLLLGLGIYNMTHRTTDTRPDGDTSITVTDPDNGNYLTEYILICTIKFSSILIKI